MSIRIIKKGKNEINKENYRIVKDKYNNNFELQVKESWGWNTFIDAGYSTVKEAFKEAIEEQWDAKYKALKELTRDKRKLKTP